MSLAVALPVLMRKLQCFSETLAPPTASSAQPAFLISSQAFSPSGFLKVEPAVFWL